MADAFVRDNTTLEPARTVAARLDGRTVEGVLARRTPRDARRVTARALAESISSARAPARRIEIARPDGLGDQGEDDGRRAEPLAPNDELAIQGAFEPPLVARTLSEAEAREREARTARAWSSTGPTGRSTRSAFEATFAAEEPCVFYWPSGDVATFGDRGARDGAM